ncbi:hypothetical protein [Roseateles chitosanitabidus]|uniref:hypothetical protein n=1 Tax=Roseateles chitosanitabidus TaxID=65048 RepID=UPI00082EE5D2|nr:hypothetical protein [Roseateles chitosanitabidus]MBO9687235.1 hypothetical protein [Roseateles chitosanitabidus]
MSMPMSPAFLAASGPRRLSRGHFQAPSARTGGLILVGIVHLLMVGALIKGFQRHAAEAPAPITLRPVTEKEEHPKPPDPLPIPQPEIRLPKLVEVPVPPVEITPTTPPLIQTVAAQERREVVPFEVAKGEVRPDQGPPAVVPKTTVTQPGAICTQMASPEMPSVNWSGEALFRAVADVQGGRVVAVQIQALGGAMDARTRRAFSNAIEGTLKSRYVCPGEHRFQQEFAFRVD